jgi:hypothetical protein
LILPPKNIYPLRAWLLKPVSASKGPDNFYKVKSANMKINLLPAESAINTWNILYNPQGGGNYNGKLTITNKRLLYDARFDMSAKGMLPEPMYSKWVNEGYLEINKADIKAVNVEKSLLAKKAILTLADGSIHTFNYGVLNIDKVVEAIENN